MSFQLPLFVKKLSDKAILPKKGSERAAGYDIFSIEEIVVPAKGKAIVKTGIAIHVPSSTYGRIGISIKIELITVF